MFLLDYPLDVCLTGAKSRVGKKRSDLPWVETEFDDEFRQCIIDFHNKDILAIYNMLQKYKNKNIEIFKSREQAEEYLRRLSELLKR